MRKLDLFFDVKKEEYFSDVKVLERIYVDMLSTGRPDFIRPIDNLINYQAELGLKSTKSFEYKFVTFLVKNFVDFLIMSPERMQIFRLRMNKLKLTTKFYKKNKKGKYTQTGFSKRLLEKLRYNEMLGKGNRGKSLARMLNIKACVYCNSQYSFSYEYDSKKISKLQLDHFFSKSEYPYFSISLYNLIPSCSYCNQMKSNKNFCLEKHSHPYVESFSDRFNFSLTPESEAKILLKYKISEKDIELRLEHTHDKRVNNHNKVFGLEGIYNNHKNIIQNILKTGKAYPKLRIKEILEIKDESGNRLFNTEEDFKREFLNIPVNDQDINSDPLSKLKLDFAKKAGLV